MLSSYCDIYWAEEDLDAAKHSFSSSSTSFRDKLDGCWLIIGQLRFSDGDAMLSADFDRTRGGALRKENY